MIELRRDVLEFSFPEVHPKAKMGIRFIRTLRIPDDGREYLLPPGLGRFPLRNVDEFANKVPNVWLEHGGVALPMYQSEAMWIHFNSKFRDERDYGISGYPFAIKIATGKVDAITGTVGVDGLGKPQNYLVIPKQPWLDGYCVKKGIIRQFVAMPLGTGYTAEEQITGEGDYGGLQITVYPMKKEVFERLFSESEEEMVYFRRTALLSPSLSEMGLAPGGFMRQEIYNDPYGIDSWDTKHTSRCFVHIANSLVWRSITGENPPTTPFTAKEYTDAGFPWFDYYDESVKPVEGSDVLAGLKSVAQKGEEKGDVPLPENTPVTPENIIKLRAGLTKKQVREGRF